MNAPAPSAPFDIRMAARLRRILDAVKLLNSTLDLSVLTRIVLGIVREEVGVDRGSVFIVDRDAKILRSLVAEGVENSIALPLGKGIVGTVAADGVIIDIPDAYADARFDPTFDPILGYRTNDIYCMPIVNREGAIVGALELMNRSRPFETEDVEFLSGISVHIGLALENAWLHREMLEKRRIERELTLAHEIQGHFYPAIPKSRGGVGIAGSSVMCEAIGGDYLDFFPLPDNRFMVALGDVSGKGIGAALVMSSLYATCRALARHVHAIEKISMTINETLFETTMLRTFVTLTILLVDPAKQRVHYVSAGHNPPVYVDAAGAVTVIDRGGGPPAGLFAGQAYRREILDVEPGAVFVIYTDGISEAENSDGEQFETGRIGASVQQRRQETAAAMHDGICRDLEAFTGGRAAHDDRTLMILKF